MRVIQLLPTISMGDAVSNDALAIAKVLRDMGYQTGIYAENIDNRLPAGTAKPVSKMPRLQTEDAVLYHMSTGSALNEMIPKLRCKKGMIYHNITPSYFFQPYNAKLTQLLKDGLTGVLNLAGAFDFCLADSEFNRQALLEMGYTCPIAVRPVLIPFSDYAKKPTQEIIDRYDNDGYVNFIFVGRIAPNKKQEDVIRVFSCYQRFCNPKSRLILVGSWSGAESYYRRLCRYTAALQAEHVLFTGHIPFPDILAYYHVADLFLCMSEHEGFCVPLVEAMYFGVPILAYRACAVPDTLGDSGILLDKKDPAQELSVSGKTDFSVKLGEDTQALDEVVVVGYGTQKKVNLTGAVQSISSQDLTKRNLSSSSQALQGLIPGMEIGRAHV